MCQENKEEDSPALMNGIDASIWEIEDDIKKSKERLITAIINCIGNIKIDWKATV